MTDIEEKRKRDREYKRLRRKDVAFKKKEAESKARYYKKNSEHILAHRDVDRQRCYDSTRADRRRELRIHKEYGLTQEAYMSILNSQNGTCKICGNEPGARPLYVDHCHVTGTVRGLLCMSCNTGLGHFRDTPAILQSAIAYLQEHCQ